VEAVIGRAGMVKCLISLGAKRRKALFSGGATSRVERDDGFRTQRPAVCRRLIHVKSRSAARGRFGGGVQASRSNLRGMQS